MTSPGDPYTLQNLMPARSASRRRLWIVALLAAGTVLLAAAAVGTYLALASKPGRTSDSMPIPAAPTTGVPVGVQVECASIGKAYSVWAGGYRPRSTADVVAFNPLTLDLHDEDTKDFSKAVEGYSDQPSRLLALRVAEYSAALGFIQLELSATGKIGPGESADDVVAKADAVQQAYLDFRTATCL